MYFTVYNCGGASSGTIDFLYKNKFTKKSDNAYVYVNIGCVQSCSESIYDNWDQKNAIDQYTEGFTINESNHHLFAEYKFIFKKNMDGTYYFVRLEKNS